MIFHFFGQQLMKNASSPKIASDAFLGLHLPLKKTQAIEIWRNLTVPPTSTLSPPPPTVLNAAMQDCTRQGQHSNVPRDPILSIKIHRISFESQLSV